MSLVLIRAALESALDGISPSLTTLWENTRLPIPDTDPYQTVQLLPAEPDDLELTGHLYTEQGLLHVNLFYPLDEGPANATTRAELIRNTFRHGATFSAGGLVVYITRTPEVTPGLVRDNRYLMGVRARWSAQVTRS